MGLIDSLNLTSLDLEDPGPLGGIIRSAPIPTYVPSTATGTPSIDGIPGPFNAFYQKYIFDETYLSSNPIRGNGVLVDTLEATGLDKDTPYNPSTDFTSYPATNTGTPTSKANPGAPSKFSQVYTPDNTYLSTIGKGKLASSVDKTNLDTENAKANGGIPYKQDKDPTTYPKYVTGTPDSENNPGGPNKFYQEYNSSYPYIDEMKEGILDLTFDSTNLDIENESPNGGIPYKQDKDPTRYPATSTGKLKSGGKPGEPTKYNQKFTPDNTYLSSNNGKYIYNNEGGSPVLQYLLGSLNKSNLDIEDGGVPYKPDKDPTRYSQYTTGTPTTKSNPGPVNKFTHPFNLLNKYLDVNPIKGKGILIDTVANTNLDVENEKPNGGIPYKQVNDPTSYPARTQASSPSPGFFATPGKAAVKFNHKFNPQNTYLDSIGA